MMAHKTRPYFQPYINYVAMLTLLFLACFPRFGIAVTEIFKNPGFEDSTFAHSWKCAGGCVLGLSNDAHGGHQSAKVTNRTHNWSGVRQTVLLQGGNRYVVKGFIKLLNVSPGHMYHTVKITAIYHLNGHNHFLAISIMHMLQKDFGWTEIGGDFVVPSGVSSVNIYPEIENVDVNYLLDDMSLQQLPTNNNWKTEANQRIETLRKGQLIVRVNNSASVDTSNMEIQVQQLKHDFGFGSSVGAEMIVDPAYHSYQQFYYNNFEWGVIANKLKWVATQHTQNHKDYDTPMKAITALESHGKTVRGHNMFWDIPKHNPLWLNSLSRDQLLSAMHTRVNDTLARTKGRLANWDVNNENLHGDYFEQKLKSPNITFDMFRWMHQIEPGVKLFLNDYHVAVTGLYTTAYKTQAKIMRESNVPVYAMGVQSHFTSSNIDFNAVKYRLDKLTEAGLPLWVTELSIIDTDNNRKADALEDVLTLYFSYPNIEGILLWGMWDGQTFDTRTAIVNGPNVTANAAGLRYQKLFKNTWRTNVTQPLHHGIHINGFHGNYVLNIMHNGNVIEKKYFHLGARGKVVTVNLHGTDSHGQAVSSSVFG